MTASITTEELEAMAAGRRVFSHADGLALSGEVLRLRAQVAAADALAEAVHYARDMLQPESCSRFFNMSDAALSAYEAAK